MRPAPDARPARTPESEGSDKDPQKHAALPHFYLQRMSVNSYKFLLDMLLRSCQSVTKHDNKYPKRTFTVNTLFGVCEWTLTGSIMWSG